MKHWPEQNTKVVGLMIQQTVFAHVYDHVCNENNGQDTDELL